MELTAEQAEGIGTFDPAQPVDRLAAARAHVASLRAEEWNSYLAAPLDSIEEARAWGRYDALDLVLAIMDGEG